MVEVVQSSLTENLDVLKGGGECQFGPLARCGGAAMVNW